MTALARRLFRPSVISLTALCALIGWGATQFLSERVRARRAEIRAEAASSPRVPDWSGEYGGGTFVVDIAPQAGYQYAQYACFGMTDAARGAVRVEGNRVHLGPAWPLAWRSWEFVLVPWGERRYLIEPDEMLEFVQDVNRGWEPRDTWPGIYLLKCPDPSLLPMGQPELPPEYAKLLRPRIEGRVVAATCTDEEQHTWDVEFDVGRAQGAEVVRPAWIVGVDARGYGVGEVTEVGETSSHAIVQMHTPSPAPAPGWRVALRLFEEP